MMMKCAVRYTASTSKGVTYAGSLKELAADLVNLAPIAVTLLVGGDAGHVDVPAGDSVGEWLAALEQTMAGLAESTTHKDVGDMFLVLLDWARQHEVVDNKRSVCGALAAAHTIGALDAELYQLLDAAYQTIKAHQGDAGVDYGAHDVLYYGYSCGVSYYGDEWRKLVHG